MTLTGIEPCDCGAATELIETEDSTVIQHQHNGKLYELSFLDVPDPANFVEAWNRHQADNFGQGVKVNG